MATTRTRPPAVLHLSPVLGGAGYPPVTGFLVTVAGRKSYLPAERVAAIEPRGVVLSKSKLDLRPFSRRPRRCC